MKHLSKEEALRLAARRDGLMVHIYKHGHNQRRRQLNRYKREGLLSRSVWGDYFVFRTKASGEGADRE